MFLIEEEYQKPGNGKRTPPRIGYYAFQPGFGNVRFGRFGLVAFLRKAKQGKCFLFFPLSIGEEIRVDEL
jgi:hypothetical protein